MKKLLLLCILALSGCATSDKDVEYDYPKTKDELDVERIGKLTGDDGIVILGGKSKSKATEGINVNSYLWRATLDTLYKMPITSADPFGGTVLTDWYKLKPTAQERYKVNVFIVGSELRSDGVKVSVFKQVYAHNQWQDAQISEDMAQEIENKILYKARELKFLKKK
jgi:hypothetical protein